MFPKRIVCLTEESVEILHHLNCLHLVVGVSSYVKRPVEAMNIKKVSLFTSSNYDLIDELRPDLIIGFSDIQKDIAKDLIQRGHNVFVANHRSIPEILEYIKFISRLVDRPEEGKELLSKVEQKIESAKTFAKSLKSKPRVYFEEWDEPLICSIRWVHEVIELCGGENIFKEKSLGLLAKERFVSHSEIIELNPNIILACWCGKKVKLNSIRNRENYNSIDAIQNDTLFELPPEIMLQPGPAPLLDGIDIIKDIFNNWNKNCE